MQQSFNFISNLLVHLTDKRYIIVEEPYFRNFHPTALQFAGLVNSHTLYEVCWQIYETGFYHHRVKCSADIDDQVQIGQERFPDQ